MDRRMASKAGIVAPRRTLLHVYAPVPRGYYSPVRQFPSSTPAPNQ